MLDARFSTYILAKAYTRCSAVWLRELTYLLPKVNKHDTGWLWFTLSALCRKDVFSVPVSSFCTRRTFRSRSQAQCEYSCVCWWYAVVLSLPSWRLLLSCSLNDALRRSAIGCLQTALSWILIRQSCCGQVWSTASCHWTAGACPGV